VELNAELDKWDARFGGVQFHFGTAPNRFLASQARLLKPGMRALCVADGEGRNGVWLAGQGLAVTAFDFSPVGVEKARRLARESGVALEHHVANINAWDWDARQFDLVAVIFTQFATPEERERMFAGVVRTLAPGGILLLQGYTPRQLEYGTGGPKQIERLYTETLLRTSFASLEILHLAEHEEMVEEGHGHRGMSALIDLVARKPVTLVPR
jgi:SAM-dependent methyltransferase